MNESNVIKGSEFNNVLTNLTNIVKEMLLAQIKVSPSCTVLPS